MLAGPVILEGAWWCERGPFQIPKSSLVWFFKGYRYITRIYPIQIQCPYIRTLQRRLGTIIFRAHVTTLISTLPKQMKHTYAPLGLNLWGWGFRAPCAAVIVLHKCRAKGDANPKSQTPKNPELRRSSPNRFKLGMFPLHYQSLIGIITGGTIIPILIKDC